MTLAEIQANLSNNPPQFNLGQVVKITELGCLGVVTGLSLEHFLNSQSWTYFVVHDGDRFEDHYTAQHLEAIQEVTA